MLGIQLSAADVTPTGLTLACNQSGGTPTGELTTGSKYWLDKEVNGIWEAIKSVQDLAWTSTSFLTVAEEFGLTEENCSTNGAFIKRERLVFEREKGNLMFVAC